MFEFCALRSLSLLHRLMSELFLARKLRGIFVLFRVVVSLVHLVDELVQAWLVFFLRRRRIRSRIEFHSHMQK